MKTYGGVDVTLAVDGGERSASRPCRFTHKEWALRTHFTGGWVGHSAYFDAVGYIKISYLPGIEPRSSSP
jgi:hypothetical protein